MPDCGLPVSRVLRDLIVADGDHGLSRYKYPPLPPRCIRILLLAPGQRGTELYGDIVIHDPEEVDYGALSCVWGNAHLTRCIHIGEATLPITESLYSALQQIREVEEEHWIWVDQICVDHESLADRNEQVGRMGEIYAKADHVIAWLGQATPGTQYIFQSLAKDGDGARPDLYEYHSEELEPGRPIYESMKEGLYGGLRSIYPDEKDVPDFMDATRDAVHSILSNPWFERTWTLQEAALCEKLFVAPGDLELTWRNFSGFLKAMPELSRPRYDHYDIDSTRRFAVYGFNRTSLYRLVDNYYSRQATDPRDKIYGLMGILDPTRRLLLPRNMVWKASGIEAIQQCRWRTIPSLQNKSTWISPCGAYTPQVILKHLQDAAQNTRTARSSHYRLGQGTGPRKWNSAAAAI